MVRKRKGSDPRRGSPWVSAEDKRKKAYKRNKKSDREDAEAAERSRTDIPLTAETQSVMADEATTRRIITTFQNFGNQLTIDMSLHQLVASSQSDAGLAKALQNAGVDLADVACTADLIDISPRSKTFQLLNGRENIASVLEAVAADTWAQQSTNNLSAGDNWSDRVILTITLTHAQKETLRGYIVAKAKASGVVFP